MCFKFSTFLPIFSQAAVRYDGPQQGEEVAEHGKGMVDGSRAVLTEQELVTKKENQDSWRERERERRKVGEKRDKQVLIISITIHIHHVTLCGECFMHSAVSVPARDCLTSHAIVGEPFTELIPHNEEHREWKRSQLAELLYRQKENVLINQYNSW